MKYKTIVGTIEEVDRLCNEFEQNHDVKFSTAYAMPDGRHARLIRYEDKQGAEEPVREEVYVKPPKVGEEGKKWIECPECAKRGVRTNIMVSHFDTCRVCGYKVPPEILNKYR